MALSSIGPTVENPVFKIIMTANNWKCVQIKGINSFISKTAIGN